jgi:hypothetical protein
MDVSRTTTAFGIAGALSRRSNDISARGEFTR